MFNAFFLCYNMDRDTYGAGFIERKVATVKRIKEVAFTALDEYPNALRRLILYMTSLSSLKLTLSPASIIFRASYGRKKFLQLFARQEKRRGKFEL